jgi:hypothetical protein
MNAIAMAALGGLAASMTLSGCAAMNKTRPGDMTVAEHEQAARKEASAADEAAQRATVVGRGASYERYSATRHRDLAKEHAAAAERRRAEVAAACEGVVFSTPLDAMKVERVDPIREPNVPRKLQNGRGYYPERLKGARIVLAPAPGGAPGAMRSITCEAARDSAGLDVSSKTRSPFAVRTARATTQAGQNSGVVVEIRSPDEDDAVEILQRAQAIAAGDAKTR